MFLPFLCMGIFPSCSLSLNSSVFLFLPALITVFWASPIHSSKENNYFASNSHGPKDEECIHVSFIFPSLYQSCLLCSQAMKCGGTTALPESPPAPLAEGLWDGAVEKALTSPLPKRWLLQLSLPQCSLHCKEGWGQPEGDAARKGTSC